MKQLDYIIVGQGIAGSFLAYQLMRADKKVLVLNDETLPTSSQVAGGIFNPITGKNLDKTWLADQIFPYLKSFYSSLENEFHTKFYHETNLYRPFANEQQQKHFLRLTDEYDLGNYIKIVQSDNVDYQQVVNDLGGLYTSSAGWVNVPKMLEILRDFFKNKESYQAQKIDNCQLQISENSIVYKAFQAKRIIFCEGYYSLQNPLFNWIPFNPAKGETLLADVESYNISEIVNQGFWIIPLGNDKCRFGSTYIWDRLDWEPSESSKELISSKISKFLTLPYKITGQEAGIRPTTKDRRPFIGNHPLHKNVYIFNGLGTKGVSLAPYFAEKMLDFLESDKVLMSEANIERFYSLYSL
ncbi:tRNA 5-methylaminomethyl-2-thiouridine biosynthesis bifunctional protein MnmC [Emticicia aquatica]|jgi:glycine/D-amino acid oxidase-like deaminating enzyme|uniref:tRNA 5-methylaminomethyl-2-thiouridine biosynthesis bifunctional protein MnmC n=1 Tax=Emticicia aquatica TaxID=1681835 RepID=A0ABM9AS77_9BACT|nr:FAD-dependent oxidoreductase [Emticicia aquatica]CAH0996166.1 tRNA 5-methylaminomethyl-2-thiouridine biosynthesis bifunctional protein MnmC [Emticicia aquatica]